MQPSMPYLSFRHVRYDLKDFPGHRYSLLIFSFLLFSNGLVSDVRMRSDRYYVYYICGGLSWAASGIVGFSRLE